MKTKTESESKYCPQAAVKYARVLFELGIPRNAVERAEKIYMEVPGIQEILANPVIPEKQKFNAIERIFPEEIKRFLKVVLRYQRIHLLGNIFNAYRSYCDSQDKILHAVLVCVDPPNEVQFNKIKEFLCEKYDAAEADIEIRTDETLLGGFVLKAGSDEYDWSLKGRLRRLEQKLTWR
ncbi:ATP synthase F1 subunit delta [Luxibacter massiliensis]|uniref:ATP synthase F1 subunit delta n=1 Tax=Luxibacter massiliensis TaxID=2219695 RepID=UPI000F06D988|nr:ATP synthase F1 subunit delta [Luxibacter massiliensis]